MIKWWKQRTFNRKIKEGTYLLNDAIETFPHLDIAVEEMSDRVFYNSTEQQLSDFRDRITNYLFELERNK